MKPVPPLPSYKSQHPKPSSTVKTEPDSTSSQKTSHKTKSSTSALVFDDDVFDYNTPQVVSSQDKIVRNEDRYSKYELGKMANEEHRKFLAKSAELSQKVRDFKELEKKMSNMKGRVTKLTNELNEKNRILETQSTELLDLEGSKSDCEIFINKLKDDILERQSQVDSKTGELELVHKKCERNERFLDEQRRLHQNLSLAHSTTLEKIKDMSEQSRKVELLHSAQLQDKDVLVKKLEQGLAQKMQTVTELLKDKKTLEELMFKTRQKSGGAIYCTPAVAELEAQPPSVETVCSSASFPVLV